MSSRDVRHAFIGLMLAMFVAMLSSTIVSAALPRIVADLGGSEASYSWVVVGTLLSMTASTPIWGRLADMMSKKMLMQVSLIIYVAGSIVAAVAPHIGVVIAARVVQGVGVGGMSALMQIIVAAMVAPRERGRYTGYIGTAFAVATVSGPLVGGIVVESPLGWRGTFLIVLPISVAAFTVLHLRLRLPVIKKSVRIDYLGGALITASVSILLIWTSLAGTHFPWGSATSVVLVLAGVLTLAAALYVEARVAPEPMIPLRLFRDRTTSLASLASVLTGVSLFAGTVYLTAYFQRSRGLSPTDAGLMSITMVGGLALASLVVGHRMSRTGRWKTYVVAGMLAITVGFALLGTLDRSTPMGLIGVYMAVLGVGIGATQQTLVLAVQNSCSDDDLGAATSVVSFARSIGGAAGVAVLGAIMSHQVAGRTRESLGLEGTGLASGGRIPDLSTLSTPARSAFEVAIGEATGVLFLACTPLALLAVLCVVLLPSRPLRGSELRPGTDAASEHATTPTEPSVPACARLHSPALPTRKDQP